MRSACLALFLVACGDNKVAQTPPDGAPPPPDAGSDPFEVGHAGGAPNAVVVSGERVYLGIGPRLVIQDLGGVVLAQSPPLRGNVDAIAVINDRAYVAEHLDLDSKIHVFDISALPAIPEAMPAFDLAPLGNGFSAVRDLEPSSVGTLYVADQEQGVFELDLAGEVERFVALPGVQQLQLDNTRLYHSSRGFIGGVSLGALDVTSSLAPLGEASYDAASIAVVDNFAISAGENGIFAHDILDIADPVERLHIGSAGNGPFARAIAVADTTAWIPANDGLYTIDVADPANLQVRAPVDAPTVGVNAAAAGGNTLVAITDRGKLLTFDVTTPLVPGKPFVADVTLCADCVDVAVQIENDLAFVADIVGGVVPAWIWNLGAIGRSPATDVEPGPDGLTLVFEGVTVANSRAYVADWLYGLRIYDATNPSAMTELGSLDTPGAPSAVVVDGQRAYLAESTGGGALRVIDVQDPARPTELGSIATSKAMDVDLVGSNVVAVTDEELFEPGGLKFYDVANPAAITLLGTYSEECAFPRDAAILDTIAIVACSFDGWHVVDITDLAAPTRLAKIPAPEISSAWSVAVGFGRAALGHDRGVIVVDLADPRAPAMITSLPTAFAVRGLAMPRKTHVVGAAGLAGVYQWLVP